MIIDQTTPSVSSYPQAWLFWRDKARTPALNMAIDETLLLQSATPAMPLLRFYSWDRPAISIGYTQRFELTRQPGYSLVRRPTGGGVVYHDHDFTYSVSIPPWHPITKLNREESYKVINNAVRAGLEMATIEAALSDHTIPKSIDRNSMVCFENPTRYDILADGKKIAGSAQRRTEQGILHQGSLYFGEALPFSRSELSTFLTQGFKTSLEIDLIEFKEAEKIIKDAGSLASEKYSSDEWNLRR